MLSQIAVIAFAGAIVAPSFADQLNSGTAVWQDPQPMVQPAVVHGDEGLDGGDDGDTPWLASPFDDQVVLAGYKRRKDHEGGEGGEGGYHHHKHQKHHRHHDHGGHVHYRQDPVYAEPTRVALPPLIEIPCGSKTFAGTLLGAAVGGLLGSQIGKGDAQLAAVAGGTFLGMFLGHEMGAYLDVTDEACAREATERAGTVPIGSTIAWNNPETGHAGTVIPVREGWSTVSGSYCREYQQRIVIDGRSQDAYGTACRQPDGSWEIAN